MAVAVPSNGIGNGSVDDAGRDRGESRMIMAIMQRGKADRPIKAALKAGASSAVAFFGRGLGIRERLGLLGLAVQPEKEVVMIVVPEHLTDIVVRAMVRAGNLDQPGVGFLFVMPVEEVVGLAGVEQLSQSA
ncbi:MAG TPA: P-II family nitrogen regulator [Chloroflexota bacterium]|nr:P-II family nitrogen regulator [Chloroflexota bacterium]